jgi:hypothetical protein
MKNATILAALFALAISANARVRPNSHGGPTARPSSHAVSQVTTLSATRPSAVPGPRAVNDTAKSATRPSAIPGPVAVKGGKK